MGDASFRMLRTYTFREYEKLKKRGGAIQKYSNYKTHSNTQRHRSSHFFFFRMYKSYRKWKTIRSIHVCNFILFSWRPNLYEPETLPKNSVGNPTGLSDSKLLFSNGTARFEISQRASMF